MIIRKKSIKVLSNSKSISSLIENITERQITKSSKSRSINGQAVNSNTKKTKKTRDFHYCIFFNIDTRLAISTSLSKVNFKIFKNKQESGFKYLSNMPKNNGLGVIAAILGSKTDRKRKLYEINNLSVLNGEIDITSIIFEKRINFNKSQDKISNKSALGVSRYSKIVNVGRQKKLKKDSRLYQIHSPTSDSNLIENSTFGSLYLSSLELGKDSASMLSPVVNTTGKNFGSLIKTMNHSNNFESDKVKNSIRGIVENIQNIQNTDLNKIANNSENVSIMAKSADNKISCAYKLIIPEELIGSSTDSFIFELSVRDSITGLTIQKINIPILHKENISNYYIPDEIPRIRLNKESRNSRTFESFLNISDTDIDKISSVNLSIRKISRDQRLGDSSFTKPFKIEQPDYIKYQNQKGYKNDNGSFKMNGFLQSSESTMVIVRASPVTRLGENISNFDSAAIVGSQFDLGYGSYDAVVTSGGIHIDYMCNSHSLSGTTILKRQIGNEYAELGKYPSSICNNSDIYNKASPNHNDFIARYDDGNSLGLGASSIVDPFTQEGKIVEYRMLLHLKNGGSRLLGKTVTVLDKRPMNYLKVKATDREVFAMLNKNSPSDTHVEAKSNSVSIGVKFKIDFDMVKTSTDMILDTLRSIGNEEIFSKDVNNIKSALSDMVLFGVTRVNLSNTTSDFLGYYSQGEFLDDGSIVSGVLYRYYIRAYLINPELVSKSKTIAQAYKKEKSLKISEIIIPRKLNEIQNSAMNSNESLASNDEISQGMSANSANIIKNRFQMLKTYKNFSEKGLLKSTLDDNIASDQEYDISKFCTGDYLSFEVEKSSSNFSITSKNSSFTRSSSGIPVLRFSVNTIDEFSSISKIDYFVITCKRQDNISICGTCHNDMSGKITFVDYINKDYIGTVEYSVAIVLVDGSIKAGNVLGKFILKNMKPEKILMSSY